VIACPPLLPDSKRTPAEGLCFVKPTLKTPKFGQVVERDRHGRVVGPVYPLTDFQRPPVNPVRLVVLAPLDEELAQVPVHDTTRRDC